jgi:hypothetical protein
MRIVNIPARRLPQTKLTRYRAAMRPGFAFCADAHLGDRSPRERVIRTASAFAIVGRQLWRPNIGTLPDESVSVMASTGSNVGWTRAPAFRT